MSVTRAATDQSFGPVRRCVQAGDPRGALEGAESIEACKIRKTQVSTKGKLGQRSQDKGELVPTGSEISCLQQGKLPSREAPLVQAEWDPPGRKTECHMALVWRAPLAALSTFGMDDREAFFLQKGSREQLLNCSFLEHECPAQLYNPMML